MPIVNATLVREHPGSFNSIAVDSITGKYYERPGYGYEGNTVFVYDDYAAFAAGIASSTITLEGNLAGTYLSAHNGFLYGRYFDTTGSFGWPGASQVAEWNATTGALSEPLAALAAIGGDNFYDGFNWGGFSCLNWLEDDDGLYVLGQVAGSDVWKLIKIDDQLQIEWTKTVYDGTLGFAFMINGSLFLGDAFNDPHISFRFDLASDALVAVDFTLSGIGPSAYISAVEYDSANDVIYFVDTSDDVGPSYNGSIYSIANASTVFGVPENVAPSAPVDIDGVSGATVAEDLAIGAVIGLTASSTDADVGDTVSYSFGFDGLGDPILVNGHFTIDATTGVVTLSTALDYEAATFYNLTIYASDGTASSSSPFTVTVTNVLPTAPVDDDAASNSVAENSAPGTATGVTAASTENNGGPVAYALTDNAGGRFVIDPVTGAISTGLTNIDYEAAPVDGFGRYYDVSAIAQEGTGDSTATVFRIYITNVNETPDAVNDDLGGSGGGALQVGYYDMGLGQGNADQVEAILAAGHIPVLITDLSDAELASIDMLLVQNPSNSGYNAEYLARLAAIDAAVQGGLELVIHDRYVHTAESILPGSAGFTITGGVFGTDIEFIDDAHSVASGPGGALNDASLDGGNWSTHGFSIGGTLPGDADLILSTGNPDEIVTFSYGHGLGSVVYSTIPLDFYLAGDTNGAGGNTMSGKAEEYATNLLDYVAVDLNHDAITDEDTAIVIDGADLLANDTDPDGDTLTISAVSTLSALGGAVTLNIDGTIGYDPTVGLNYLAEGEVVEDSFTYTVDDGNGGTDTATVTFRVVGINDAPTAPVDTDGPSGATISEHLAVGSVIGLDALSTDPEGDPVSYSFGFDLLGDPILVDGHFTIDPVTGVVTLTSAVNFELDTSHSLTIYANDGTASSSTEFTVNVTNVVEHLFTPFNDGTEANPIDFNLLPDGAYDFDGAQYDALAGNDWVILPDLATVDAGNPWDYSRTFSASAGNDVIQGGDGNDIISGGEGNDWLFGADGDDRLVGSSGNDILAGGDGSDKLTGSSGKDIFIFTDSELGTIKLGEHDTITDFKQGEDKIDISALFDVGTFAGIKAGQLTGNAGSIYKVGYYTESGKTWVTGDTNGNGLADFTIELAGSYKLKGTDLVVSNSVIGTEAGWNAATAPAVLNYAQFHSDYYLV